MFRNVPTTKSQFKKKKVAAASITSLGFLCTLTGMGPAAIAQPSDELKQLSARLESEKSLAPKLTIADETQDAADSDLSRTMIDMSSNNAKFQITPKLKSTFGIELVVHRATLGVGTPDRQLPIKLKQLFDGGYLAGAYHVAFPTHTAAEQVQSFVEQVSRSCVPNQRLLLAVDWEGVCTKYKSVGAKRICVKRDYASSSLVDEFIEKLTNITHKPVIVYTGRATLNHEYGKITPHIYSSPLWLATYYSKFYREDVNRPDVEKPEVTSIANGVAKSSSHKLAAHIGYIIPLKGDVSPWTDWVFWQFGEGKGPDISSQIKVKLGNQPVDMNFFNGGRTEFRKFFDRAAWTCPSNG